LKNAENQGFLSRISFSGENCKKNAISAMIFVLFDFFLFLEAPRLLLSLLDFKGFAMKIDILAVGVHPDDVELSCSGTLLGQIDRGKTVGLLDLTRGELGTRGTAAIRESEALEAARMLGAQFRWNLDLADGFFTHDRSSLTAIARAIRGSRPEIVLCNALSDRHPDHGRAAKLVADACFFSGLVKIETWGDDGQAQAPWRPRAVYHYIQDRHLEPDFVVDIAPYLERKMELVLAFRSQFYNPDLEEYAQELSTPISGKSFLEFLRAKAAVFGRPAGFDFAEGFQTARTPGVGDLFDLI
jgi:N-acetylglucosamine malate deacetylase 1